MRTRTAARRLAYLSIPVIVGSLLCSAATRGRKPPAAKPKVDASPARRAESTQISTRVYMLKHADATAVQRAVERLFAGKIGDAKPPKCVADERTNSLIVVAPKGQHDQIEQLLAHLDTASTDHREIRIYELRHTKAASLLASGLTSLLGPKDTISVDPKRNVLVVKGTPQTLGLLSQLLKQLDVPTPASTDVVRQVRVVWLVAGSEGAAKSKRKLPPDLKEAAGELAKLGVDGLQVVAQFMARCAGSEKFLVSGQAQFEGDCEVSIEGQFLEPSGPRPTLKLMVSARRGRAVKVDGKTTAREYVDLATLETTITAPPGHAIVLGMTPTGTLTSVFVVTIHQDKPKK